MRLLYPPSFDGLNASSVALPSVSTSKYATRVYGRTFDGTGIGRIVSATTVGGKICESPPPVPGPLPEPLPVPVPEPTPPPLPGPLPAVPSFPVPPPTPVTLLGSTLAVAAGAGL